MDVKTLSVREFIYLIAKGNLHENDILLHASSVICLQSLLNDLDVARIAVDPVTGKPYAKDFEEAWRLDRAISLIQQHKNKPGPQQAEKKGAWDLPSELDTERARRYFNKAIEAGYIVVNEGRLSWVFGGNKGKVRLGYFVVKVFAPNNTEKLPETAINRLFSVERIGSSIAQIQCAKKRQAWVADIDKLFE